MPKRMRFGMRYSGSMGNPVSWLWKKIGGHAIWDVTKWLWAAGGGVVTTAAQSLYGWVEGHPNAASLMIGVAAIVVFIIGAIIIAAIQKKTSAESNAKRELPHEATPRSAGDTELVPYSCEHRSRNTARNWGRGKHHSHG